MPVDASAYRALGLHPGADTAAVEAAYRKLIKQHHPDICGGDAARAAEINWAFDQIRKGQNRHGQLPQRRPQHRNYPAVRPQPVARRGRGRRLSGLVFAAVVFALIVEAGPVERAFQDYASSFSFADSPGAAVAFPGSDFGNDPVQIGDAPLDSDAIDRSVRSAVRIARDGGLDRLTSQSRRCHAELRRSPGLSRLDQCVAFDEAAIVLTQPDTGEAEGQFSAASVTARQLGAARLLSDDFLAIESRLDQIRSRVEFELAPVDPQPVALRQQLR